MTHHYLSPAKLNLFLHVIGRRQDGYHLLQSVIHFLNYGDDMYFNLRSDNKIILLSEIANLPQEQNLIYRAARLLQENYNVKQGVEIKIDKKIPLGAGLGGGSSNAATTLIALNQLWELNLSRQELSELGLSLGADVPIFVFGEAAAVEGIGEILTPIHVTEPWFIVLIPPVQVSTQEIFSDPQLTRDTPARKIPEILVDGGHNDCWPVVKRRYPVIDSALIWLNQFAHAKLTGTGCAVFAAVANEEDANAIAEQAPASLKTIVAQGLNQSPIYWGVAKR